MTASTLPPEQEAWQLHIQGASAIITLRGDWRLHRADELPAAEHLCLALPEEVRRVGIVLENLTDGDSLLPALLLGLRSRLHARGTRLALPRLPPTTRALLALTDNPLDHEPIEHESYSWLHYLGVFTMKQGSNAMLVGNTVFYFLRSIGRTFSGHSQFRGDDFFSALNQCTLRALPIISVVSLLLGSILAFVGSIQLEAFGASLFIADTVGIAVAREMAAIMTAIVIAGHTGAAFAAQLASMRVNEEIDALRTLGLSPYDYLAVPRVLALTLAMPMLYLYAAVLTLFGSLLVANLTLGLSPMAYAVRTVEAVPLSFFTLGLAKSICFGALIGLVSCHIGLTSGKSAEAVGGAATQAVVISILGIIAVDSVFAIASILFEF